MASRSFPGLAGSIPLARRFVGEALERLPQEICQAAALLVSELATNAVRHGGGNFRVTVEDRPEERRLWVGVTDDGRGRPQLLMPPVTAEHGRGLQLVGRLASRWGVRRSRDDGEKTVWFELSYST